MQDKALPDIQMILSERLSYLVIGIVLTILSSAVAYAIKFYKFSDNKTASYPPHFFIQTVGAFALFFFVELFIVPTISLLWMYFYQVKELTLYQQGWINNFSIIVVALATAFYSFSLPEPSKKSLFGLNFFKGSERKLKDFLFGMLTWFISYPIVIVVSQLLAIVVLYLFQEPHVDQVVVQHLKAMAQFPLVFSLMVLSIVIFAPLCEEILFRGFLQTWLKHHLGLKGAIVVSSIVFASFHFSLAQGIDNIELLTSLFILSCFLGFIFEKNDSLLAPLGLHMFFNFIGTMMIYYQT